MPKDEFWISLLTTLIILHQTMSASDTTEPIGAVGRSVTFLIQDTSGGDAAVWSFGNEHIVTATFEDPPQVLFSIQTLKKRFTVSEKGRALSISQLTLQDAGTYSVTIGRKRSTFILRVYRELAEPTVTCEAQDCSSDGSCRFSLRCSVAGTDLGNVSYTWRVGDRQWNEGPVLLWVDKPDLEGLGPPTCTAQNPVSSRSITVITPDLLCTGSLSGSWVTIGVIAWFGVPALLFGLLLLFLCKSRVAAPMITYTEDGPSQQDLELVCNIGKVHRFRLESHEPALVDAAESQGNQPDEFSQVTQKETGKKQQQSLAPVVHWRSVRGT